MVEVFLNRYKAARRTESLGAIGHVSEWLFAGLNRKLRLAFRRRRLMGPEHLEKLGIPQNIGSARRGVHVQDQHVLEWIRKPHG